MTDAPSRRLPLMSPQELEVLRLLAEGKGPEEMRKPLRFNEATVRNIMRSIERSLSERTRERETDTSRQRPPSPSS
jgi:DNA-binding CsgD family transcriptional regulator